MSGRMVVGILTASFCFCSYFQNVLAQQPPPPAQVAWGLDCQPPTSDIRTLHIQDFSGDFPGAWMSTVADLLPEFNSLLSNSFGDRASMGILKFSSRSSLTGNSADVCWEESCAFSSPPSVCEQSYRNMADGFTNGADPPGSSNVSGSHMDALAAAAGKVNWDVPLDCGIRVVYLYTNREPLLSDGDVGGNGGEGGGIGVAPASLTLPPPECEVGEPLLSAKLIGDMFAHERLRAVLFVSEDHLEAYRAMFASVSSMWVLVLPLTGDREYLKTLMLGSIDHMLCGLPEPTIRPLASTIGPDAIETSSDSLEGTQKTELDFELRCQLPSPYVRVMHAQDVSPSMSPYRSVMTGGGVMAEVNSWVMESFPNSVVGLSRFTNKPSATFNPADICFDEYSQLSSLDILPTYLSMPHNVGLGSPTRSILDVLWELTEIDWDTPQSAGRRVVILYSDALPAMPSGGGSFDPLVACNLRTVPDVSTVVDALKSKFIFVIFVVASDDVASYSTLFAGLSQFSVVTSLSDNASQMRDNIFEALNTLYCGRAPTIEPQASSPDEITCTENAVLQLLHLQDVSYSYTNDLANMKAKFPQLLSDLESMFYSREVALGTFVDKPFAPVGYAQSGDYCYKEETSFTTDATVFTNALNGAETKSGRDWKESQYDAVMDGLTSTTLGWESSDEVDGRRVLRVVLMATDAGPHVSGDFPSLPPTSPNGCQFRDYPSPAQINSLLQAHKVYPIFVVTSDLYNYWVKKMTALSATGRVIRLADPVDDVMQAILDALEDLCQLP